MGLTTVGLNKIVESLLTDHITKFNYLGVGDGTLSFTESQTDLQGTTKFRKVMDGGFPKIKSGASNVIQGQVTFATNEANFHWQEWGVFDAGAAGNMLSRVQQDNSTKLNNQVWVLAVELTFTV